MLTSCGGGGSINKNPYCEFVDGNYTFDIDLRRSMFFIGKDFEYDYFSDEMKECRVDDAEYVRFKAIGHYYDENVREEENVEIYYSALIKLPEENSINECSLNIFTTLEAERVIYLVRSGYGYDEAIKIVQKEIWEQLNDSGLFSFYDFLNVRAFGDLNIDDECLNSLTAYFSKLIFNTTMVVEDKTLCSSVLVDFVNCYATTGDLELSTFNLDVFSKINPDILSLTAEELLLKISIAHYKIPFDGGVPHIYKGRVFYGVDTSSFNTSLAFHPDSKVSLFWPRYKNFTCNGYFDLQGSFSIDSSNVDQEINIAIKNELRQTTDTTFYLKKDMRKENFSQTIWLEKEGKYNVIVSYGGDEIDLNVHNVLKSKDEGDK